MDELPILSVAIRHEHDTVDARQRARQIARLLGFDAQDQTRISTAVSEIARNAFNYAGGGRVEYSRWKAARRPVVHRQSIRIPAQAFAI